MEKHRIFTTKFSSVYPCYVAKAERKGRTEAEVDEIICWLSGITQIQLNALKVSEVTMEDFFGKESKLNPARRNIHGVICGIRVEDMEEGTMKEIRYLDKLVDELAKGKQMDKILRR